MTKRRLTFGTSVLLVLTSVLRLVGASAGVVLFAAVLLVGVGVAALFAPRPTPPARGDS